MLQFICEMEFKTHLIYAKYIELMCIFVVIVVIRSNHSMSHCNRYCSYAISTENVFGNNFGFVFLYFSVFNSFHHTTFFFIYTLAFTLGYELKYHYSCCTHLCINF